MSKNNCKECTNRFVGCHAECESYQKYQKERELIRRNRFKVNEYFEYSRTGYTKHIRYALNHK